MDIARFLARFPAVAVLRDPLARFLARLAPVAVLRAASDSQRFLKHCTGVIHVGASYGQERYQYDNLNLAVVWIEPIPEQFEKLLENISSFPRQRAIKALITDRDGDTRTLKIANNDGQSSSILDLHQHKDIWPEVKFCDELTLTTSTLQTALSNSGIRREDYDALVLDTQGSELLVLKGAQSILHNFKYIRTEAADFEVYKDCPTERDITEFLAAAGFSLVRKDNFAEHQSGGQCFDLLYRQTWRRSSSKAA